MIIGPYIRTAYSLLESLVKIDELIIEAQKLGYTYLALVDTSMNAARIFTKCIKTTSIRPIYGLEIKYEWEDRVDSIVLYAKDDEGMSCLYKLSTMMHRDKLNINNLILSGYSDHLLVVLPSTSAFLDFASLAELKKELGDFYLGLSRNDYRHQKERNTKLKKEALDLGIPSIAFYNTLYVYANDEEAFRCLTAIRLNRSLSDDIVVQSGAYLLDAATIKANYEADDLARLQELFDTIYFEHKETKTSLPDYPVAGGHNSRDFLISLTKTGLNRRLKGNVTKAYSDRLKHELKVIIDMDFVDYFLIVYDFILYAKKNGILVGPGRGSAAGSLVAYCLGITDIDPVAYGLIFERFLNSERVTMPDIDVDLPANRRQEVIDYVANKYGKERVAHITTYDTFKSRQALTDVAKAIGYSRFDRLRATIRNNDDLKTLYAKNNSFRQTIDAGPLGKKLLEMALRLEGLPRHFSTHATGIVLSKLPLIEVAPLVKVDDDLHSVGLTLGQLEDIGLIKIDFCGLGNLDVIAETVTDIRREIPNLSLRDIRLDDAKTYRLIADVNTIGIFQLDSAGMRNIIRKLKPKTFTDIAVTIALFRPGPMQNIPAYLENRAHPERIKYLHPLLKPILEETYGIIIYQEQIMQIAQVLAKFSYAKADIMRRAMAKKNESELKALQNDFIEGCITNGIKEDIAKAVYDLILRFANYGFNKSHSVAYALISYWQAYLKANYPLYFYKALMNGNIAPNAKTYEYISECRKVGLKCLAPDINKSKTTYFIEGSALRMPLGIIKNVGGVSAAQIVKKRTDDGPYRSYEDAVIRLKSIGTDALTSLIDAGAFDCFGKSRRMMRSNLKEAMGVDSLAYAMGIEPSFVDAKDDVKEVAMREKAALGFTLSVDPLAIAKKQYAIESEPLYRLKEMRGRIYGFGQVEKIKVIRDKKGQEMAFMSVSDETDVIDLVIFAQIYERLGSKLLSSTGRYIVFYGQMQDSSVKVESIEIKD